MEIYVYVHKDEDAVPDEDFYAFEIRVHAVTCGGLLHTQLWIYSRKYATSTILCSEEEEENDEPW